MSNKVIPSGIWALLVLASASLSAQEAGTPDSLLGQYSGIYYEKSSNQYFINDKVSFSIRPSDDEKYLDKIQYSVDNGPYADYGGGIKFDNDGFHVVRFKAVDPVLNWSPIQTFRIYVDLSSPESAIGWLGKTYTDGQNLFVNKDSQLVLSAQDNLSGVSQILWKRLQEENFQHYKAKPSFSEGVHQLEVSAIDKVGNAEPWRPYSFTVDSSAPETKANIKGSSHNLGGKLYIDKGTFLSLESEDKFSGVNRIEYKLNNGSVSIYSSRISIEEPVTKIEYRAVDNVGNAEQWKSMLVHLDSLPPQLALQNQGRFQKVAGKFFARKGFRVIASIDDKESGPSTILVGNERSDQKATKKDFVFDNNGEHSLYLSAEDNVGNTSNYVSYSIVVDEGAPETKVESSNPLVLKENVFLSGLPNKLEFKATDTGVGVDYIEVSFDNKEFTRVNAPIDLATWKQSRRKLYYRAVDKLGNVEPTKEMTLYVRHEGPKVDLFVEQGERPPVSLSKLKRQGPAKTRVPSSKEKGKQ